MDVGRWGRTTTAVPAALMSPPRSRFSNARRVASRALLAFFILRVLALVLRRCIVSLLLRPAPLQSDHSACGFTSFLLAALDRLPFVASFSFFGDEVFYAGWNDDGEFGRTEPGVQANDSQPRSVVLLYPAELES